MSDVFSPASVTASIQGLLHERKQHAEALARIDQTLERVSAALGQTLNLQQRRRPGRPKGSGKLQQVHFPIAAPSAPATIKRRGKRNTYAVTGEQSVLGFIQKKGSPTTRDIKQHWVGEGRRGSADNLLTLMVKAGKLRRQRLNGVRGSMFSIP
jgi:hypothetical protein